MSEPAIPSAHERNPAGAPPALPRLDELRIHRGEERSGRALWPWALLVLLAAGAVAFLLLRPRPPLVRVAVASEVATRSGGGTAVLNATGYVTARRQATVSSKVTGRVTEVLVEEGTRVEQGQLLATIDPATPNAALHLAESQVTQARTALEETQVRIEQARLDQQRQEKLQANGVNAQADLDTARSNLKALQAHLAAQRDDLAVAERQLAMRHQDVIDTEIRAPFAGIVTSKDAQPGEMISPMSAGGGFTRTGVCTVVDMASLELDVDVNEAYINRVRPAQPVEAVLDAYPDWKIPAHVITIVPTADRQKATVMVRIALDTHDPRILPDMGVKVSFIEEAAPGAKAVAGVVVPKAALRRDGEHDVVWVVGDGDRLERRAVQVADTTGEQVRLLAGAHGGERVVVAGPPALADGARVRIDSQPGDAGKEKTQ